MGLKYSPFIYVSARYGPVGAYQAMVEEEEESAAKVRTASAASTAASELDAFSGSPVRGAGRCGPLTLAVFRCNFACVQLFQRVLARRCAAHASVFPRRKQ